MRSALSLPLYEPGKEIFGVLTLYSTAADAFSRENLRIMMALESQQLSLALQNALIFRDADNGARLDYLTQLPNIRQILSFQMEVELSNARRSGESLGVVVCDLNSFKAVNDRHGHAVGDKLLRAIADGFKETCRKEDTVARMGGDEFVFLLPGADSQNCANKVAVTGDDSQGSVCESPDRHRRFRPGPAAFFPEDADSAEALLDSADHRMYSHKRSSAPKNRAKRDFFVPYTSAT